MKGLLQHSILIGFFLLIPVLNHTVLSQEAISSQTASQYRGDYNISKRVHERLSWSSSFGYITTSPHNWSRIYIDPSISYDWPRMFLKDKKFKEKLIGGLAFYYTNNVNIPDQLEIRPYQGYSLIMPNWDRLTITHSIKLEERFEISMKNWSNTFGLRFRYKGLITLRFNGEFWEKGKGFYIPASIELYWNLIGTTQFNDKANADLGIGREFNSKWKALISYGYNYSKAGKNDAFNTGGMRLRLRVYHKLD